MLEVQVWHCRFRCSHYWSPRALQIYWQVVLTKGLVLSAREPEHRGVVGHNITPVCLQRRENVIVLRGCRGLADAE